MKKRSHLFVTREIIEQVPQNKRKWLLLGSILPDILVHTYIKKHTWKSSFDNTVNRIQKLEEKEEYMKTKKYVEEVARNQLGLVYPDEIVIRPKE